MKLAKAKLMMIQFTPTAKSGPPEEVGALRRAAFRDDGLTVPPKTLCSQHIDPHSNLCYDKHYKRHMPFAFPRKSKIAQS